MNKEMSNTITFMNREMNNTIIISVDLILTKIILMIISSKIKSNNNNNNQVSNKWEMITNLEQIMDLDLSSMKMWFNLRYHMIHNITLVRINSNSLMIKQTKNKALPKIILMDLTKNKEDPIITMKQIIKMDSIIRIGILVNQAMSNTIKGTQIIIILIKIIQVKNHTDNQAKNFTRIKTICNSNNKININKMKNIIITIITIMKDNMGFRMKIKTQIINTNNSNSKLRRKEIMALNCFGQSKK